MLKTALMLLPVFAIIGLGLWFLMPGKTARVFISDQKQIDSSQLTGLSEKLASLEDEQALLTNKVDSLESSNSALLSRISQLQTANSNPSTTVSNNSKKSPVLIPINPGGNVNSTSWTNLTSGSITIDPADYPGYKAAFLIINLSVYVGQGTAFAQLVNPNSTLAIIPSQVSTNSYSTVSLTSGPFQLPKGSNTYTIQLRTLTEGYPAQAADSFLQITY